MWISREDYKALIRENHSHEETIRIANSQIEALSTEVKALKPLRVFVVRTANGHKEKVQGSYFDNGVDNGIPWAIVYNNDQKVAVFHNIASVVEER